MASKVMIIHTWLISHWAYCVYAHSIRFSWCRLCDGVVIILGCLFRCMQTVSDQKKMFNSTLKFQWVILLDRSARFSRPRSFIDNFHFYIAPISPAFSHGSNFGVHNSSGNSSDPWRQTPHANLYSVTNVDREGRGTVKGTLELREDALCFHGRGQEPINWELRVLRR